jgi:hypothetical protein
MGYVTTNAVLSTNPPALRSLAANDYSLPYLSPSATNCRRANCGDSGLTIGPARLNQTSRWLVCGIDLTGSHVRKTMTADRREESPRRRSLGVGIGMDAFHVHSLRADVT